MHCSRIAVPAKDRRMRPTYLYCTLGPGHKSFPTSHKTCGARAWLCSSPLYSPNCCTHGSLAASALPSVFALPLCLYNTCTTSLLDWTAEGEAFCLSALSMLPGYSVNKDFFLPASCSFILPGNSASMPTLAWQGLQTQQNHFWCHAGHVGPQEVTAHRQGLAANWLSHNILEHQLCTERTFLSVCCIHHFFTN